MDTTAMLDELLQQYAQEVLDAEHAVNLACDRYEAADSRLKALLKIAETMRGNGLPSVAEIAAKKAAKVDNSNDQINRAVQVALSPRAPISNR